MSANISNVFCLRLSGVKHWFSKTVFAFAVCLIASCASSEDEAALSAENTHSCGSQTPTHFYVTEVAPTLRSPDNVFFDISNFPTFENSTDHPTNFRLRSANIKYKRVQTQYSPEELECWSAAGDQLALVSQIAHNDAWRMMYNHLNLVGSFSKTYQAPDTSNLSDVYGERTTAKALNENFEKFGLLLQDLKIAASMRDDYCSITKDGFDHTSANCQPNTMLSVFKYGLPDAHFKKYNIYYGGPEKYRNAERAQDELLIAALMGHARAYQNSSPFECRHYNRIRKNVNLKLLFEMQYDAYSELHRNALGTLEEGLCR